MDWLLVISIALGIVLGFGSLLLLIGGWCWLVEVVSNRRKLRGLRAQPSVDRIRELETQLRETEADRYRLEIIARELLAASKTQEVQKGPQEETPVQIRSRYERLID